MAPTLSPGDRLLIVRARRVVAGDLVVVRDPRRPARLVVKRVTTVTPAGVTVVGDNPTASTDSRTFGAVPPRSVWGRVVYRYAPESRRARLGRRPSGRAPVGSLAPGC